MAAYDTEESSAFMAKNTDEKTKSALEKYGNNVYERLINMAQIAQKDGIIKGILLQQDGNDTYDEAWLHRVKKIYYNVVNDLSLDSTKVPLLIGEVGGKEVGGKNAKANETIRKMTKFYNIALLSLPMVALWKLIKYILQKMHTIS